MGSSLFTALTVTKISVVSLLAGLIIGMLAQRSRMCFIGGWRDFFLVKDSYLLKGFIAYLITAVCLFIVFYNADYYLANYPWFNRPPLITAINVPWSGDEVDHLVKHYNYCDLTYVSEIISEPDSNIVGVIIGSFKISAENLLYLAAAFVIGLFSVFANGCPLRQHVMAASGNLSSVCYIIGVVLAVLFFDAYLVNYLDAWLY